LDPVHRGPVALKYVREAQSRGDAVDGAHLQLGAHERRDGLLENLVERGRHAVLNAFRNVGGTVGGIGHQHVLEAVG
jgi:hypothetical protein